MNRTQWKGIVCAVLSAVSFGTIPLFALPLYQHGMNTPNVLFYRFSMATVMLGAVMLLRGHSFRLARNQIVPSLLSGLFLAVTCLFLFLSLWHLDAGVAATVLFVYPIMVALIMIVFFHEKLKPAMGICMFLALGGIALLYQGDGSGKFSVTGLVYALLAGLFYSIYMVNAKKSPLRTLSSDTLTFYAMLFGLPVFLIALRGGSDLRLPPDAFSWGCLICLACFPALASYLLLAFALQYIGPTMTAVIGVLEPATSVVIGVACFGEKLTFRLVCGILVILFAVTLTALGDRLTFARKPEK
ncbi:MAG: DMT family transporter [Lentisphaeria bacterium]|nr:DMT family transporter [Lentisphaeria bacterium]